MILTVTSVERMGLAGMPYTPHIGLGVRGPVPADLRGKYLVLAVERGNGPESGKNGPKTAEKWPAEH